MKSGLKFSHIDKIWNLKKILKKKPGTQNIVKCLR